LFRLPRRAERDDRLLAAAALLGAVAGQLRRPMPDIASMVPAPVGAPQPSRNRQARIHFALVRFVWFFLP
jgi:hypothetical protein